MDVEFGGIYDYVSQFPHRRHSPAFLADSLCYGPILPEWMRAARLAETAHQRLVARFYEDQRRGVVTAQLAKNSGELLDLLAFARVHQQSGSLDFAAFVIKFVKGRNQRYGKIINAVKTKVFKGI